MGNSGSNGAQAFANNLKGDVQHETQDFGSNTTIGQTTTKVLKQINDAASQTLQNLGSTTLTYSEDNKGNSVWTGYDSNGLYCVVKKTPTSQSNDCRDAKLIVLI